MLGSLPEFVDPYRLSRQRARLKAAVPIAAMVRVATVLRDDTGLVDIDIRFHASASGVPRLDGSVRLLAPLECQRCLEPIELELLPELRISFTDGDEASGRAELAAGYEPLESEGAIELTTIVEDEILLALPDFPMHPPDECTSAAAMGAPGPESSPFSGLRTRFEQIRN